MKAPGASGCWAALLAALTTPPAPMMGTAELAWRAPPICSEPCSAGCVCCALTVTVTCGDEVLRGCQVAVQRPSFSELSAKAGSPDEKVATTLPDVMKVPQSSTMVASMGVGQPAVTLNPVPSCVNTGISLVGLQPAASGRPANLPSNKPDELPAGITIKTIATRRIDPSWNTKS